MYTIHRNHLISVDYMMLGFPDKVTSLEEWKQIEKEIALHTVCWSDKNDGHEYLTLYWEYLKKKRIKINSVLEIGVKYGHSLCMWNIWFENPKIVGVDIKLAKNHDSKTQYHMLSPGRPPWGFSSHRPPYIDNFPENISLIEADVLEYDGLDGEKFDFIIDDGSHKIEDQLFVLNKYYKNLNKNGILIIEDIESMEAMDILYDGFEGDKAKLIRAYHRPGQKNIKDDSNILIYEN